MNYKWLALPLIIILFWTACMPGQIDTSTIATDSISIAKGQQLFIANCSSCHNFLRDGIGPQLGGLTSQADSKWIASFISNPNDLIGNGDERASDLYKKYKVLMPSFESLGESAINYIIAYLHTQAAPAANWDTTAANAIQNPIADTIANSTLTVTLKELLQLPASSDSGRLPLTRITKLGNKPGTDDLFLLDLHGKLYHLQNNKPQVYMDLAALKPAFMHQPGLGSGFGSFAFSPNFAQDGLFYTTHTEKAHTAPVDFGYADSIDVAVQWVLTEWKTNTTAANTFTGKGRELLRINMVSVIHGIQEIMFNPLSKPGDEDFGLLYVGIGEGGGVEHGYPFLAHNKKTLYGTVIRINPTGNNSQNGRYGIPPQNPFVKDSNALGEIYAYGFRNPHRITWNKNGDMLVSNIGHGNIESINLVQKGNDFGWPIREGNFVLNPYADMNKVYALPADDSIFNITYPVAEYDHGEGKAISGGYEYMGIAIPALKGKFLFGDIPTGRLFYVDVKDLQKGKLATIKEWHVSINGNIQNLRKLCGSDRVDLHFGRDANGEMYIMTKADGRLYLLSSATE
jgi:glucose/arabinose dehydrogenase